MCWRQRHAIFVCIDLQSIAKGPEREASKRKSPNEACSIRIILISSPSNEIRDAMSAKSNSTSPASKPRRCSTLKNHFFNMWRDMVVYGPVSPSAQGPPYQPKKLPFEPYKVWLGMTPVWGYISTYKGMPWNTSVDRHFNPCFEKHYPMPLHCFLRCYQYSD